jgi:hypothetical protein
VHTMLNSLIQNQNIVERGLSRLRLFDKMFSTDEWIVVEGLSQFLNVFKQASAILSGTKYPTLSLALFFRAEIE